LLGRCSGLDRKAPPNPQIFGNAGIEHMEKYGTTVDHFAKIAWKNHRHRCDARVHTGCRDPLVPNAVGVAAWVGGLNSVNNPYSQFQTKYSLDEVKNGRKIWNYLTLHQCCPTSDGAACVILASEDFVRRHNLVRSPARDLWPGHPGRSKQVLILRLAVVLRQSPASRRAWPSRSPRRPWPPTRPRPTARAPSSWPVRWGPQGDSREFGAALTAADRRRMLGPFAQVLT